jgi:hypothetical protein
LTWNEIVVSSKIQGHISAGIYRSAGGALKELVSNAFDADATQVIITTNWPSFDIVTCRDNGTGMTPQQFETIMKGGIGDSSKRTETDLTPRLQRPVIGRLGIGMLGVAQICHVFQVISHCAGNDGNGSAFHAKVKLADYLHEKMDEVVPEETQSDNATYSEVESHASIDVGLFSIEEIPYDPKQKGTYIIATDMRAAFVKKFRQNPGPELPMKPDVFIDYLRNEKSVREMGDYWQMVWELAISCPIPYLNEEPFNVKQIDFVVDGDSNAPEKINDEEYAIPRQVARTAKQLEEFDFELLVDGLSLRKPNVFPSPTQNREGKLLRGTVFLIEEDLQVAGRPLKLSGYIYLQDGMAIIPMEMRGLLIRIRSAAVGTYDPTFLNYPKIEGPRYNWLSGEIYVERGLEHALNIDRDSFNQMHPHYVRLQKTIHDLLPKIFSTASSNVSQRSRNKRQSLQDQKEKGLKALLVQELGNDYELIETDEILGPLEINASQRRISINEKNKLWPKSRTGRELARLVGIAFEASMQEPEENRRQKFYELLNKMLDL